MVGCCGGGLLMLCRWFCVYHMWECEVGYDSINRHLVVLSRIPAVHFSCQRMLDFRVLHHVTQDDFGFEQQVLKACLGISKALPLRMIFR